ncbi:hypothetical protein SO802_017825 [Lithocarpus litseifolius]|uniref:Uncharacterized protein n=1 Tax=Lithocarpus litseifolius TaxID=425828 RepID=A0AAW2CLG1_9ROSI
MMSDATTLVKWDFVGGDVEAIVDLQFVGVDNLSVESRGQVDGKLGFSCPSGPHDNNNLVLLLVIVIVIMIMVSLSVMRSGVHARPTGFFEEELGFGRREKRIVGIRRVLGLGRGIRVLDKPHLYSHRERERERTGWCCSSSSC